MSGGGDGELTVREQFRERERAAVMGLALSQLVNEDEVRAAWEAEHGLTFPTLDEALKDLTELTHREVRLSHRTFTLQLLAKVARHRGTRELADAGANLRTFATVQVAEGNRLTLLASLLTGDERQTKVTPSDPEADEERKAEEDRKAEDVRKADEARKAAEARKVPGERRRKRPLRRILVAARVIKPKGPQPEAAAASPMFASTAEAITMAAPSETLPLDRPAVAMRARIADAPPLPPPGPLLHDPQDPSPENAVLRGLDEAASGAGATPWEAFVGEAGDALNMTPGEVALPICTDEEHVLIGGQDSTRVVTWFSTSKPAVDFAHWTDPRRWHLDCSLFYESLTTTDAIAAGADNFTATFREVVRLTPTTTLVTPLVFTRTVVPPNLYAVHFALPQGVTTPAILVDSGSLIARHDPQLPPERGTQLQAEKCIKFADPAMASWPSMCCDLFWSELTITVALGCAQDGN